MVIHFREGTERWKPSNADLGRISSKFEPDLPGPEHVVEVWPRSQVYRVTGKELPEFSFRAVTRGNTSFVFVDGTETRESVAFLIAHELTHQIVHRSPTVSAAFNASRPHGMAGWTDEFHDLDAEERFCDGIARNLLGTNYDRDWWRRNVERLKSTTPR